jgi:predicted regulator of Ras-like GTPase activity (Roadblock/LC7/MglB family)
MTKADQLANALDEFLSVSADVEAAAVVSADGLPMASALPPYVEEDRLAAMSAALLTLGERASDGLGKGALDQVFVEGEHGHVVLMAAGPDAVLVSVTARSAKVGLVLFEMRRTSAAVAAVMASGAPSHVDDAPEETAPPVAPFEPRMPEPVAAAETEPEARLSNWQ